MRVIIKDTSKEVGNWVANYVVNRIKAFAPSAEKPFVLGLPTGSSPIPVYKELIRRHRNGEFSFQHVVTFNMDEYVNLPQDHPESYHSFMYKKLFNHIDILPENIHILNGNASDLEKECRDYEKKIESLGGIELFMGSIGPDGHVAFNEPGSSLASRTRVKTLCYDTIEANSRFFNNDMSKVPTHALTVGVGTVMDAKEVVLIITGFGKARAVREVIEGSVSHIWTVSMLQMHENTVIALDESATMELRVKTVKYFNQIEEIAESFLP